MQAQCSKTCLKVFEGKSTFAKNSATLSQLMCLFVRTYTKLLMDRTGLAKKYASFDQSMGIWNSHLGD